MESTRICKIGAAKLISIFLLCLYFHNIRRCDAANLSDDVQTLATLGQLFGLPMLENDPCSQVQYVTCSDTKPPTVLRLNLTTSNLNGTLPTTLTNLQNLEELTLDNNAFSGVVPDLSPLTNLILLNLNYNELHGVIPVDTIIKLKKLRWLYFGSNQFVGNVPDFSPLPELIALNLSNNHLGGPIPDLSSWTAKNISGLFLHNNQFTGPIPDFTALSNLSSLFLHGNNLSGPVPPSLFQLENMAWLRFHDNPGLFGSLPDMSLMHSLKLLFISGCNFSGPIPESLTKSTKLLYLDFHSNKFTGQLPSDMRNLSQLQVVNFDHNELEGNVPEFPSNGSLQVLYAGYNKLTGPLPSSLGDCKALRFLSLPYNQLTGEIPRLSSSILEYVDLQHNQLSGPLPEFNFNTAIQFAFLGQLYLNDNQLNGSIPQSLAGNVNLLYMVLDNNNLGGPIPDLSSLNKILQIKVSRNKLSGKIPVSLASLGSLQDVWLDNNRLSGTLPDLSKLVNLRTLHLENNTLTGPIPEVLSTFPQLIELILDNNNFTEIPASVAYKKGLNISYTNNPNIRVVGSVNNTSNTNNTSNGNPPRSNVGVIVGSVVGVGGGVLILAAGIHFCFRRKHLIPQDQVSQEDMPKSAQAFSYKDVKAITQNFQITIGKGGYGPVYHGILPSREEVAVKVNGTDSNQGGREFLNEVSLLSRLHHRNLVPLVGYCLEGPHQILIYVYMAEGTLYEHLYSIDKRSPQLGRNYQPIDWKTRLNIALNAARGLEYLHKDCHPPVIHRDVKASNILLTRKLEAKVGDLGISKLAPEEGISGVSTAVKGTFGYLDPEYFIRRKLTTKSDVYSFGVVLLELITSKKPQSLEFPGSTESNIADWVRAAVDKQGVLQIVDPNLEVGYNEESLMKVTKLALSCTEPRGADRPDMGEVVHRLVEALQLEGAGGSSRVDSDDRNADNDAGYSPRHSFKSSATRSNSNNEISTGPFSTSDDSSVQVSLHTIPR